MSLLKILLFIFLIQIVYVSAYTLRMILTLKGQKYIAALISMGEIVIYVLGLNLVLNYLKLTRGADCVCSGVWTWSTARCVD